MPAGMESEKKFIMATELHNWYADVRIHAVWRPACSASLAGLAAEKVSHKFFPGLHTCPEAATLQQDEKEQDS